MKKITSIMLLLAFTLGLAGCNTFRGFGQDMQKGGEKIQDAATNAQSK